LSGEVNIIAVADSKEILIGGPVGLNNFIIVVRGKPLGEKFGENLIAVAAERMPWSEVVFLEFLAIQNGNCH
jgi:hypothetical protein